MPAYSQGKGVAIYPGDTVFVFNNESPANGTASQYVALGANASQGLSGFAVDYFWAAGAVAAVSILVQVSQTEADADYFTIDTLATVGTGTNGAFHNDYSGISAQFVRLVLSSQTGAGAITASITR